MKRVTKPAARTVPAGLEGTPPAVLDAWRREHAARAPRTESGPEFLTVRQLEVLWNVQRSAVGQRLRALEVAGRVERGARRVAGHFISAYRLLPNQERTP
jgi:hypothetical protein